jgi:hypothetical protein
MGCPSIYVFSRFVRIRTSAFGADDYPRYTAVCARFVLAGTYFCLLALYLATGPPALSHRNVTNCDRQIKPLLPAPHLRC